MILSYPQIAEDISQALELYGEAILLNRNGDIMMKIETQNFEVIEPGCNDVD